MANTTFVNLNTIIVADWLNDVNNCVYNILGNGTLAPSNATDVKTNLSLQNVDNTSDVNKPLSTAATNALATKVDKTSSTGSAVLPVGTTAQRDGSPTTGYIRYNTTLAAFEGYGGSGWAPISSGSSTDYLNTLRIDVASATTVDLTTNAPNTRNINITGTTTITGFTVAAGQTYFVRFNAALTLTNNAAIITQRGENITTSAGDTCILRSTAANTVEVLSYVYSTAVVSNVARIQMISAKTLSGASVDWQPSSSDGPPSWTKKATLIFDVVSTTGSSVPIIQLGDSGGVEASGYVSLTSAIPTASSPTVSAGITTGFGLNGNIWASTIIFSGKLEISYHSPGKWKCQAMFNRTDTTTLMITSGDKTLSDVLDRIRLTTVGGADTFDAGTVTVVYEG